MKRRRAEESADGLALMTSSVTSSQSADGLSPAVARYQQVACTSRRKREATSWFESSSRKIPAGSLYIQTQERSDVVEEEIQSQLFTSRWYLEIAIAKRCSLHKLIRQRFALALKIQQMLFALITSRKIQSRATVDPVARFIQSTRYDGSSRELQYYASSRKDPRKADVAKHCNQAQSIQSIKISVEDEFSRSDKPAAKQLTIYEELSKLDVNC
ncbi:hypothetical protein F511_32490 [Dorcoceras hygrometricum]|uniref:Uncharacterized protein n=1 Tax=Dorcoceras hygrometricum TaxID=472368 RepID=A0A2Z7C740_9LAMI|nr:hypothetical protein F511_32490 [Dorcoceras hygrometricum]